MKTALLSGLLIMTSLLAACSAAPVATPAPVAAAPASSSVVSASGKVLPEQWANLIFRAGGPIVALSVQAGDEVESGEALARLDETDAQLAVAQAEAALAMAQAQLTHLKAGARPEQVTQAEQQVSQAEAAWRGAQAQLAQLQAGARSADIAAAEASLAQAAMQLKVAQDNYDKTTECVTVPGHGEICPGLGTSEEQARAALNAATEGYAAAQKRVTQLKSGATKNELAAASANVDAMKAQWEQTQAQLALIEAGATAEQLAVAEAGVNQAQVAVDTAQTQLDKMQLSAPFDATVGTVLARQGEVAAPGQPIAIVGDLGSLRVETTDLSEVDVARVKLGQPVKITFDALPGRAFTGQVTRLAAMSTPGQSAVNYVVTIALDEIDPALRWGMTAFVDIQVEE